MPFTESSFRTLRYFPSFSHMVCKLLMGNFQSLYQSLNCMSWVIESCNISWRCLFVPFQTFFWFVNCANLVYELCITWSDIDTCFFFDNSWPERLFSTVSYLLGYYCWSVNYASWVSKFYNFCLTCAETKESCIFEDF